MRPSSLLFSALAAGVVLACAPGPVAAEALTEERCTVHATFAYGLVSDDVTPDQLAEYAADNIGEAAYFNMIVEYAQATQPTNAVEFGNITLAACNAAVKKGAV